MSFAIPSSVATFFVTYCKPLITYFNPLKFPYSSAIAAGIISLLISCNEIQYHWYPTAWLIYVTIWLFFVISFKTNVISIDEDMLKFSRGLGISVSLFCLAITAREVDANVVIFWFTYMICLLQISALFIYSWIRTQSNNSEIQTNVDNVQLILSMCIFLVSSSIASSQYVIKNRQAADPRLVKNLVDTYELESWHYLLVTFGFYLLWLVCFFYLITYLYRLCRPIPHS